MDLQEYNQKVIELDVALIMSTFELKEQPITYHTIKYKLEWPEYKVREAVKHMIETGLATERIGLITILERYPWQAINKVFVEDAEY
jgi:hypothetical protein